MHSRCNLACTYCYVYEYVDQSWRTRPKAPAGKTIDATAARIAEHAATHNLERVRVVLHGGEPLLAGKASIKRIARRLRAALPPSTVLDLRMQTNAVLLARDVSWLELLLDLDIKVGVSLDGDQTANDRHRIYRNGQGSHADVVRAVQRLGSPRYRPIFAGILCTINIENDAIETYESLVELDPPRIDLLLPHANRDDPPPRPGTVPAPYADWLIAIHDRWLADARRTPIRIFDSIRSVLAGGASLTEALGTEPADLAVVDTDGTIQLPDSLKTAYEDAPDTGRDVFADSFDTAATHPGFVRQHAGVASLSAVCRSCTVVDICGGGLYAHRYEKNSVGRDPFDNPSVHCDDLFKLINHVAASGATDRSEPAVTENLRLPSTILDSLADGHGDGDAMRALREVHQNITRDRLGYVHDMAYAAGARSWRMWKPLQDIERSLPDTASALLAEAPHIRTWAERCLASLRRDPPDSTDLGSLSSFVVAAAARGGFDVEIALAIRNGMVHVPTFGAFVFDDIRDSATVTARSGALSLAHGPLPGRWREVCRLKAPGITVLLDDVDPYAIGYGTPLAPRLDDAETDAWQRMFAAAWHIIQSDHADYAPALAAGLSTIVPLARPSRGQAAATVRTAFGAVGIARPDTADELALLLVHEFQHVKLNTLFDMFDLHDPSDSRRFRVRWRRDLRPADAVLHGVYAFAAVADVWRTRWQSGWSAPGYPAAGALFVFWREAVAEAADQVLRASGALTPRGTGLAERTRSRVEKWLAEPVPRDLVRQAAAFDPTVL